MPQIITEGEANAAVWREEVENNVAAMISSIVSQAVTTAATTADEKVGAAETSVQVTAAAAATRGNQDDVSGAPSESEMTTRAIEAEVIATVSAAIEDAVKSAVAAATGAAAVPMATKQDKQHRATRRAAQQWRHIAEAAAEAQKSTDGAMLLTDQSSSKGIELASQAVPPAVLEDERPAEPHVKNGNTSEGQPWTEVTWRCPGRLGLRLQQREGPQRGVVLVGFDDEELSPHLEIGSVLAQVLSTS